MATPNNQAEQFYCSLLNKRKDILCPISTATEALSYSYMYCSQIGYTIKKKHYSQSFDGCCFDKYNKQNNRV